MIASVAVATQMAVLMAALSPDFEAVLAPDFASVVERVKACTHVVAGKDVGTDGPGVEIVTELIYFPQRSLEAPLH